MIKAVFFDVDGTLLSFKTHKMPESTRKILNELRKNGIKLFISTGRAPLSFLEVKPLLDFEFDGYVMLNGQYCMVNGKIIYDRCMDVSSIEPVLVYLKERDISCEFVELDYVYMNSIGKKVIELKKTLGNTSSFPPVDDVNRIYSNKTYQLSPFIPIEDEEEFLKHMPGCRCVRWNPLFVDVIPEDGGKPVGMKKILDFFGITREESMAFGDGGNDIEMLKYAEIGVAMGNAEDEVKKEADYVAGDIDDDGISEAVKHILSIGF